MHGAFGRIKEGDSAPAQLLGVFGIKTGNFDCQNGFLTFLLHPDQTVDVNPFVWIGKISQDQNALSD
jgi:hypothetical protein